MGLQASYLL